ncbi:hypothetical protein LINPERHAP1_LOCUS14005, partial [Linum perenne]
LSHHKNTTTKLVFHHQSTLTLKFSFFFPIPTLGRRRKSQTSFDHEFALAFLGWSLGEYLDLKP